MAQLDRFTVSLDTELLAAFDHFLTERGYDTRSEAIRDMIRSALLASRSTDADEQIGAVLTVVCEPRAFGAWDRLRALLIEDSACLRGELVVPLGKHADVVIIALEGDAAKVNSIADRAQALRGITQGNLFVASSAQLDRERL